MTLLSAYDDFVLRTLDSLPALLERLRYIAGLRGESGTYRHWGLERTHGEDSARHAMAAAHSEVFLRILRMPLRQLAEDCGRAAETGALAAYLQDCSLKWRGLLPADLRGGHAEHFNSVLTALWKMQAQQAATRQVA